MLIGGIVACIFSGQEGEALTYMLEGVGSGVTLCITLCGAFLLWMGLMNVAKEAGLVDKLSRTVRPLLKKLLPNSPTAVAPVTLNLAANFFGLGGAATPFGLAAMREMDALNPDKGVATDDMCMFIALNASALELLPTTVLSLRAAAGSGDVYAIVVPTFIVSLLCAAAAITFCKICAKAGKKR